MMREPKASALWPPGEVQGDGREVLDRGDIVFLWLIDFGVWQKPSQYCKIIILQLKIELKKK